MLTPLLCVPHPQVFDSNAQPGLAGLAAAHRRASLVLGPHGAGLTGIVFAAPGAAVLEVATRAQPAWFRSISATLGLRYRAMPLGVGYFHRSANIQIEPEELARVAAELLAEAVPAPSA